MEYFLLTCGEHTKRLRSPELASLAGLAPQKLLTKDLTKKLEAMNLVLLTTDDTEQYADIITSPVYLVSNTIKELFEKYDKTLSFKALRIIHKNTQEQFLYWIIGVDECDCLSEQTEFLPMKILKKLVLKQENIGDKPIFKVGGISQQCLVVRLDVAESLLRRFTYGIELRQIKMEEEYISDAHITST